MGEMDALGFRYEAKKSAVAIKAPGPALLDHLQALFVMAIQQLVGDPAGFL